MPDDHAFLRAIGAAPGDDAPRLIYADWLDEQRQSERAEFIRVQCELARPGGDRGRRTELRLRERELLKAHRSDWARPFKPCHDGVGFRRGFIEVVSGGADLLERLPSHLFATGIIDEVRVTGPLRPAAGVRGFSHMHTIRVLRLCSLALTSRDLMTLSTADQFATLEVLDLRWNDLTTDGFWEMIADDLLPPGRTLFLGGNHFGPDYRGELAEVLGDRVSFAVDRPRDHQYELTPTVERISGLDAEYRQVVITYVGPDRPRLIAYFFDLDGEFLGVEDYPPSTRPRPPIADDPVARLFAAHLGMRPGPVSVKKFDHRPTGIGIADFTEDHWDLIHDPPPPDTADPAEVGRAERYRRLKYEWVPSGGFYFGEVLG